MKRNRYRLVLEFDARDGNESDELMATVDQSQLFRRADRRIEVLGQRLPLHLVMLLIPAIAAVLLIGYKLGVL